MTSKSILTQLDALQKATLSTDGKQQGSFAVLFDAFLDIAEDPAFLKAGKPTKDKTIKGAIEMCARSATGNNALIVQGLRMLRIGSAGFLHGSFFADASTGSFFYFEKARQGLIALARNGGLILFTRMTMLEFPESTLPVPGPPTGSPLS